MRAPAVSKTWVFTDWVLVSLAVPRRQIPHAALAAMGKRCHTVRRPI